MRLLLDTHALLWALTNNSLLSRRAAALIEQADNQTLISAMSAYEICAKHALGKLPGAAPFADNFMVELGLLDVEWLPVTPEHAIAASKLTTRHRDPFDRLLAAQALVEGVPLVSKDTAFDSFGVERIW